MMKNLLLSYSLCFGKYLKILSCGVRKQNKKLSSFSRKDEKEESLRMDG
ncbi:hypothetical protein [Bacteroides pyogenes]|nr:hypothetical protein [Bacteroides pyogenes]MDY4248863.1 hypothetical protein [Bacteroides pyogenes]